MINIIGINTTTKSWYLLLIYKYLLLDFLRVLVSWNSLSHAYKRTFLSFLPSSPLYLHCLPHRRHRRRPEPYDPYLSSTIFLPSGNTLSCWPSVYVFFVPSAKAISFEPSGKCFQFVYLEIQILQYHPEKLYALHWRIEIQSFCLSVYSLYITIAKFVSFHPLLSLSRFHS